MSFTEYYDQFVREHGILFENKEVPMDESDIRTIQRMSRAIFGFFAVVGMGLLAMLYFNFPSEASDWVYAGIMTAMCAGGSWWVYGWQKGTLEKGTKTVIQGIITDKKSRPKEKSARYTIRLSNKEDINITEADFKRFVLGDIVRVELLGTRFLRPASAKVILIQKLPGIPVSIPEGRSSNSIFARAGRYVGNLLR